MHKKVILIVSLTVALVLAGVLVFWLLPPQVDNNSEHYEYSENVDGTITLTDYHGYDTVRLRIPDQLDGKQVTGLASRCFTYARKLTRVDIPAGITNISANPFCMDTLRTIHVDSANPALRMVNSMLYSVADGRLLVYPAGIKDDVCVLPPEIKIIGICAFDGCKNLIAITLHDQVTTIESLAFEDCSGLTAITIPDSVAVIGVNPFLQCTQLMEINVSAKNAALAVTDGALYSKADMKLIAYAAGRSEDTFTAPQGIRTVGRYALQNCDNLSSITLLDGVVQIEGSAFYDCERLVSVTIPQGVTQIGNEALSGCEQLHSCVIPYGVTSLGFWLFLGDGSLTSVTIPSSVTDIGFGAFENCAGLTLTVEQGSEALRYAEENGIPWIFSDVGEI